MNAITTILVGTDFSDASTHALDAAIVLAEKLGASIELVHVYSLAATSLPIEGALIPSAAHAAEVSDDLQRRLDDSIARVAQGVVPVRGHLRVGNGPEELARAAEELKASLIVVGTHSRTGLSRMLLGSVAERVVRTAHRPVMTVPPEG